MVAAAKKGALKKKRSDPTRTRRPDPDPSPPPPETRRSLRSRQTRYLADFKDELDLEEEEERERESKERRKLKLVLKLPPISTGRCRDSSPVTAPKFSRRGEPDRRASPPSDYSASTSPSSTSSSSRGEEEEESVKPLKKRRIERVQDSDGSGHREERRGNVMRTPIRAVSGTPMPERKTLEETLDKLQKKDTYGVFAEPVDPEELPDYHDVIEHPMDFGTVRRKLKTGQYRSFEQFEDDVFLICSNAMQYNAPDTIYFRQARSIQDMARRNFQEVRADLISNGTERESEGNIKSASDVKNTIKKLQCGIAPRPSSFDISSEKKTLRQPCRNTVDPLCCEISFIERKTLKKQYRTTDPQGCDISSMEKKTLKKPQYRTAPEPPGTDISSMEKKIMKKPHYRTAPESRGSDVSSMENKTIKMLHNITAPEPQGSDVSSMEKKTIKKFQNRTAPEPRGSDVSSMEKKTIRKPQIGTTPKPPDFDISSIAKTVKKPQRRTTPETLGSDISSIEKTTVKKPQHRTEPEPLCSDISCQDKKTQKEHQSRTAPESLGSDNSSGAALSSVADAFTGLSKKPADSNASAADPCTGFSTSQPNGIISVAEPCFGLTTGKAGGIEGYVTANGFVDGNSSLGESKPEKAGEVPAKCSPSKLAMRTFVVDMNRRATYDALDEQPVVETDSVVDVFEGETRQLHAVGLNSEYSYARSLARFAASLGPIAWEIASKKIEQALPAGVKFGPGWIGEYEPLLTPVLYIENSMQQQLAVTRKDKGNEIKSEAISTVSRKDKGNESMSEVSNGQRKDMPFGLKRQMTSGRPFSKASNPLNEGTDRTHEQKQGLIGVNLELHPCTSRMTLQQQKNQPAGDLAKGYTNETAGRRLGICSEVAKSTPPAVISHAWNHVQTEHQKLQQQKNQVAQMQVETQKLQKKNQVAGDFAKAYTNETNRQRPELYSEARTSNFQAQSYLGRSQVQAEPLRQPEAVTSERRNDSSGMNVGGLSNWESCDSRHSSPFGIISNHQAGVQYWLARGSQEQAVNDPLRWMSSSGKLSNQPNTSNRCINDLEQSVPTVQIPKRDNPNAAAAAQAWMSIGASAEWKSVDGGGLPSKQVGSASFNPAWKTPSPASRAHEEANIRPEALLGVTENNQVQTKGLVIFPQLMSTDVSRLRSPWQGLVQHSNKQKDSLPPDLNISFQPPGSPARSSPGILIDSQQPDLALQL